MVRFGMVAAALALMASPLLAQESTEDLKKELQQLRKEVDSLKAVNSTKEVPAMGKIDADAMAADDSPIMTLFKGTKLSGFVDTAYSVSFNQLHGNVNNGSNIIRAFDNRDNSFYLHNVQLQLERLASKDMIVGYHLELQAGHDIGVMEGTIDSNGDASAAAVGLQEAWIQILAPLGNGLDIRVGKMASLIGYEVPENTNNLNYSRGALWSLIEPVTATGIRLSYSFVEQFSATIGINNGLQPLPYGALIGAPQDTFADLDHSKMLELQALIKPIKDLWIAVNLNWGNDLVINNGNAKDFYFFNIVAEYKMDKLTVAANFDQFSSQVPGTGRLTARGIAGYAKYQLTEMYAPGIRLEYLGNTLISGPGNPRFVTFTFTNELKVAQHLILRIEFRADNCNQQVFTRDNTSAKGDYTLGFEALLPF